MSSDLAPKADSECVKVVVRCRPMNQKEIQEQRQRIVDVDLKLGQVSTSVAFPRALGRLPRRQTDSVASSAHAVL